MTTSGDTCRVECDLINSSPFRDNASGGADVQIIYCHSLVCFLGKGVNFSVKVSYSPNLCSFFDGVPASTSSSFGPFFC